MNVQSQIKCIYIVAFLDLFAVSLALPLFSAHIRSLGVTHFVGGLISAMYSGLQLISGPIIGSWSDVRGRRSILLLTLLACSLCYISIGIATTITLIVIGRIGLGMLKHTQTLCRALVSDITSGQKQAEVYGTISAISGAGFILGPIIGGHMMEMTEGFKYVCFLVSALFCINMGIVYVFIPKQMVTPQSLLKKKKTIQSEMLQAIKDLYNIDWSRYWDIFTLKFVLGFTMFIFFSEYSISIQERFQLTPKMVGYTISFQGLVGSVSGISIGYLDQVLYRQNTDRNLQILHGFILLSISLICISLAPNLGIFISCLIPLSACSSLLRIISTETMLERTSSDKKGTLIGTSSSVVSVARLVAPVCSGLIRDMFGTGGISTLSVIGAVLGTSIASVILKKKIKMQ